MNCVLALDYSSTLTSGLGHEAVLLRERLDMAAKHRREAADLFDYRLLDRLFSPAKEPRRRYTIAELLEGASEESMSQLNAETAWAREGGPIGQELA